MAHEPPTKLHQNLVKVVRALVANFNGTCEQPSTITDLNVARQKEGETLRGFIHRFCQVRNGIPRINDAEDVATFCNGVVDPKMCKKMVVHDVRTTVQLYELTDKCARAAEAQNRSLLVVDREVAPSRDKEAQKLKLPGIFATEPEWKQQKEEETFDISGDGLPRHSQQLGHENPRRERGRVKRHITENLPPDEDSVRSSDAYHAFLGHDFRDHHSHRECGPSPSCSE